MMSQATLLPHMSDGDRNHVVAQLQYRAARGESTLSRKPNPALLAIAGIRVMKPPPVSDTETTS